MSEVVYVHTLSVLGWWALAQHWLRHLAAPVPRQWLPYPCFKNPPQGGKSADPGLFWPRFFPQSSYPQYWDPTAWPLAPRAVYFSITSGFFSGKKLLLPYSFQSLSAPNQSPEARGREMAAIAMLVTKRTDLLGQPCVSLILLHFIFCAFNSLVFTLVIAGKNVHKCFYKQTQIRLKCNCPTTMTCLSIFHSL